MNSIYDLSAKRQADRWGQGVAAEWNEALVIHLLKQETLRFMLRSFYGSSGQGVPLARRILQVFDSNASDREKELLGSLLSTASGLPHDANFIEDQQILEILRELQKLKIRERLDPRNKTISVYFPDGAYRKQVGGILEKLGAENYNTLTFVGTLGRDEQEKTADVYYGGHGLIEHMDFVDLFVCATFAHNLPAKACKVYFMHDIHDSPVSKEEDVLNMILEYDYYFIPSSSVMARVRQQIGEAKTQGLLKKDRTIGLIPGGYIKLDQNIRAFQNYDEKSKVLIHAPTVADPDIEDYACLPRHSERIVGALLENFPDYEVIFRPHPHTLKTPPVARIVEKFKDHARFTLDDNPSFYMDNYARSALMVTDFSGTAFTYAFTTLRPVVFFSHQEDAFQKNFEGFSYVQDREKVGQVSRTIDQMVECTRALLENRNAYVFKIQEYRNSLIYNLGQAENYFVENVHCLLNGERHGEWVYMNIQPELPQLVKENYKDFNIIKYQGQYFAVHQKMGAVDLAEIVKGRQNPRETYRRSMAPDVDLGSKGKAKKSPPVIKRVD